MRTLGQLPAMLANDKASTNASAATVLHALVPQQVNEGILYFVCALLK